MDISKEYSAKFELKGSNLHILEMGDGFREVIFADGIEYKGNDITLNDNHSSILRNIIVSGGGEYNFVHESNRSFWNIRLQVRHRKLECECRALPEYIPGVMTTPSAKRTSKDIYASIMLTESEGDYQVVIAKGCTAMHMNVHSGDSFTDFFCKYAYHFKTQQIMHECKKNRFPSFFTDILQINGQVLFLLCTVVSFHMNRPMLLFVMNRITEDVYLQIHAMNEGRFTCELSYRESQIAKLAVKGYKNKYIASQLQISEGTVKKTLYNIYSKLGITSRMGLLRAVYANEEE